mmetsp:Transcript_3362/g.9391  ORF Transcript_3362/g.9391 Transcript_3362/m.9391 type:complete len:112 (+) Transcript_3362:345-680(+)
MASPAWYSVHATNRAPCSHRHMAPAVHGGAWRCMADALWLGSDAASIADAWQLHGGAWTAANGSRGGGSRWRRRVHFVRGDSWRFGSRCEQCTARDGARVPPMQQLCMYTC